MSPIPEMPTLSRLSDIAEPRDRIQRDSRIFKQFKISCHKIEILALVFDLLLVVLASTFGSTIYQYVWPLCGRYARPLPSAGGAPIF